MFVYVYICVCVCVLVGGVFGQGQCYCRASDSI